jgi:phosphoglucosamine mutase
MSRNYFGTDGIRGRVGQSPMTPEFALKLGWAAGRVLAKSPGTRVLIGKDTRRSGYMFESALEAGLAAAGVEALLLGPLPTPAVAYLTKAFRAQAGIVISASHNPHFDNGVKFFSGEGDKLDDALEAIIEAQLNEPLQCVAPEQMGRARRVDDAAGRYIEFCKGSFGSGSLKGLRIVVDCANGAAYRVAPAVFEELGASVTAIAVSPDGFNINEKCGSTHPERLCEAVRQQGADVGVALDGDGDRCLMVTHDGHLVDGDELLFAIASHRQSTGALRGPVVGTLMSNLGLEQALTAKGIRFERANVGDRYVLEKLRALGGIVGGETSGHMICLDRATTGDGMVTALQVLDAMLVARLPLSQLVSGMKKFPQVLINVKVSGSPKAVMQEPALAEAVRRLETKLGVRGRVLLRASGTEPLVRVMVEADENGLAKSSAEGLAAEVRALVPAS